MPLVAKHRTAATIRSLPARDINHTLVDRIAHRTGAHPDLIVAVLQAVLEEVPQGG
jgi:hypothetical protein